MTRSRRVAVIVTAVAFVVAVLPGLAPYRVGVAAANETSTNPGFKTRCDYTRTAPDDPIVFPGMPGVSHSHDFFGSTFTGTVFDSSNLLAATTTCSNPADHSAYWAPTLSVSGTPVVPSRVAAYYVSSDPSKPRQPYPAGLRMIAGDGSATAPQERTVTAWVCGQTDVRGTPPISCPPGSMLALRILFPDCWNGMTVDSADHKSHMAYALADGSCAATHPIPVPKLVTIVHYPIGGTPDLSLSNGGIDSAHADFVNGWEPAALAALVSSCINGGVRCR
ncbi:MAG: DUF1996 domain-containing protein [Acidimicrobiales bacterium]